MEQRRHRADTRPRSSRASTESRPTTVSDIVYFARAPWDGVKTRGHHLVEAIAQQRRIFYIEPPVPERTGCIDMDVTCRGAGLFVVTPHLLAGTNERNEIEALRFTIHQLFERFHLEKPILWYETARALSFSRHLTPLLRVFDYPRRSVIAAGSEAEPEEADLLRLAEIVFTSTQSVFETVRRLRPGAVFLFPDCPERGLLQQSSTEFSETSGLPTTQRGRVVGSFVPSGSAIDLELLDAIISRRPDISFEIIGVEPPPSPRPNASYRVGLSPRERETVIRRWDAALFPVESQHARAPFPIATIGEVVRLGVPVVATPTTDIVGPLGRRRIIQLAQTCDEFIAALEYAFEQRISTTWRRDCGRLLSEWTWERTAQQMLEAIGVTAEPYATPPLPERRAVGFSW